MPTSNRRMVCGNGNGALRSGSDSSLCRPLPGRAFSSHRATAPGQSGLCWASGQVWEAPLSTLNCNLVFLTLLGQGPQQSPAGNMTINGATFLWYILKKIEIMGSSCEISKSQCITQQCAKTIRSLNVLFFAIYHNTQVSLHWQKYMCGLDGICANNLAKTEVISF